MTWTSLASACIGALVDLIYPLSCVICRSDPAESPWEAGGLRVPGLRRWDRPSLCRGCNAALFGIPVPGCVSADAGPALPVLAAAVTTSELVELVGAWKYNGLRGLSWPLGRALSRVVAAARDEWGPALVLVPIPLHAGRRRARGFNQAEILSRLVAAGGVDEMAGDCLQRRRDTRQQAKVVGPAMRARNVAGAFRAVGPPPVARRTAVLVDDLVTSGATVLAAAAALRHRGWDVAGAVALGIAVGASSASPDRSHHPSGAPVDTPGAAS